ncbi:MAG: hypothetical protein QOH41_1735 [Blastocatellia bacterium]|nr:hypothetical protein [Blastocatellia bacterium]
MRNRSRRIIVCSAVIFLTLAGTQSYIFSQSSPDERPQLKDFGSSLKRLKWDSKKQTTVEKKRAGKPGDSAADDVIRVETNLVVCDVQVRDKDGKTVLGLTKENFIVTEDGRPQRMQHFSLGNDLKVGRSIVLLIDYSGSESPYINNSVEGAKVLVDQLGPKDTVAIVTDDVEMLVDFTRDKVKLKKALDSLKTKSGQHKFGRSKQFSALMATVRELFTPEDIRPIVIFQTDGDQVFHLQPSIPQILSIPDKIPESWHGGDIEPFSLRDLYHAIERSRASIYTVIPGPRLIEVSSSRDLKTTETVIGDKQKIYSMRDLYRWGQLAAAGAAIGGWTTYLLKPEDALDIYARILADINSRYVIGYYPINKEHDGKRRKVLVEVRDHPEYSVSGRKSYIAPEPEL